MYELRNVPYEGDPSDLDLANAFMGERGQRILERMGDHLYMASFLLEVKRAKDRVATHCGTGQAKPTSAPSGPR